jgi:Na+-transporting methylmalonyl-CoA/oxaloacetate decarboxylase gamma subunit
MYVLTALWFISLSTFLETIFSRITVNQGLLISAIGLVTVFTGLIILWAVTSNLKNIIYFVSKAPIRKSKKDPQTSKEVVRAENLAGEIIAAITIALHFELEEEIQIITMRHIEQEMSPWVVASRSSTMRSKE